MTACCAWRPFCPLENPDGLFKCQFLQFFRQRITKTHGFIPEQICRSDAVTGLHGAAATQQAQSKKNESEKTFHDITIP